jgi:predicted DCC family thiol-disulfide oxidoreductase YuxK
MTDQREGQALMLFDGVCNFCNATARFVAMQSEETPLRFCSMQSAAGQALLRQLGLPTDGWDTFVLIVSGKIYTRSEAALLLADFMKPRWRLVARVGSRVPNFWRDQAYDLVARLRYRFAGRSDRCALPTASERQRFIVEESELDQSAFGISPAPATVGAPLAR